MQISGENEEGMYSSAVATGLNDFAFSLSSQLLKGEEDENFLCSPYSAWLPLAALSNVTDNENREVLLDALGQAGIATDDLSQESSRMLYELNNEKQRDYNPSQHNTLQIANALFVRQDQTVGSDFEQVFLEHYDGRIFSVDLSKQDAAVQEINHWASEHTEGAVAASVADPDEQFEMNCNRPFVFILCDGSCERENIVLFTGVVNNL